MADEDALSSLVASATLVVIGGLFSAAGTLLERVIVGRLLSPEAYGEVSIGLTILTVVTTITLLGFTQGVPRYVARLDSDAERRGVWLSAVAVSICLSTVVAALLFVYAEFVVEQLFDRADSVRLVRLFAVSIPFVTVLNVGVGGIRGMENTKSKLLAKDVLYPFLRIVGIVALLTASVGILSVGYAYVFAAVIASVAVHVLLNRLVPLIGPFELQTRELVRFSVPLVIATLLASLLLRTDTLMLGFFRSSFEVGQYSAAYPLGRGMLILLSAFGFLYLPLASSLDADGKREEIDEIYATTTKWIFIGTFPAFVVMLFFSEDILRIFFGAEYEPAGIALTILVVGFFSNAIGGRNRETLSALGYTGYVMLSNGLAFGLNIALNIVLIPMYGFVGAAVASAASIVLLNAFVCALLSVKFDISPFSQWSVRAYVVIPVTILPPAYVLSQHVTLTAVTLLPFLIAVGLAGIGVGIAVGAVQPEDRVLIDFVESQVGFEMPLIKRYLPAE